MDNMRFKFNDKFYPISKAPLSIDSSKIDGIEVTSYYDVSSFRNQIDEFVSNVVSLCKLEIPLKEMDIKDFDEEYKENMHLIFKELNDFPGINQL